MRRFLLLLLLLTVFLAGPTLGQQQVTGKVQDQTGAELPGVTVLVKGTNQ